MKGWNVKAWKSVPSGSENQPKQRGDKLLANQLIRAGEEQGAWGGGQERPEAAVFRKEGVSRHSVDRCCGRE